MNRLFLGQDRSAVGVRLCAALALVATSGFCVVGLRAQSQPKPVDSTDAKSSTVKDVDGPMTLSPDTPKAVVDAINAVNRSLNPPALGPFRLARSEIPQGVSLRGAIRGAFVEPKTKKKVETVLDINDASGYGLIEGAPYEFDLIASSNTTNLYGLTLGNAGKKGTVSQVALTSPAKVIHLRGEIEPIQLLENGPQLRFSTARQRIKAHPVAKKENARDGVRFRGAMIGKFLNFNANNGDKDRFVFKALDALALGDVGLLGADYVLALTFTGAKAEIYGAVLGPKTGEELLRVDVDTPQHALSVQSVIQGARFSSTGMGWGVSKSPDISVSAKHANLSGTSRFADVESTIVRDGNINGVSELPKLQGSKKAFFRASAQVPPPAPTPTPRPNGGNITIGGISFPIILDPVKIGPIQIGTDNPATGSSSFALDLGAWGQFIEYPGTKDACSKPQLLEQPGNFGYYTKIALKDTSSLNANQAWKTKFQPEGIAFLFPATIAQGKKNVKYQWTQWVSVQTFRIVITYQRGKPIDEDITVINFAQAQPNIDGGDSCPPPPPSEDSPPQDQLN